MKFSKVATVVGTLLLGILLIAALTGRLSFLKPSAAEAFSRAEKLRAAGQIPDALLVYQEAIRRDSRFAPPHRALALLATAAGDSSAAVVHWAAYVERDPKASHALCWLAQQEMLAGQEVSALQHAEQELQKDRDCPRANLALGLLYAKKSNAGKALTHLKIAANAYPDIPQVQLVYGRVLAQTGQYADAEKLFTTIIAKNKVSDKVHVEPYRWLGYVFANRSSSPKDATRAEALLRQALKIQPDDTISNLELGQLLVRDRRRTAEAISLLSRAAKLDRNNPKPVFSLIEAHTQAGNTAAAATARAEFKRRSDIATRRKSLLRQYAVAPKDVEVNLQLARIEIERGDPHSALLFLDGARAAAPEDSRVRNVSEEIRQQFPSASLTNAAASAPPPPPP